MEGFSPIETPNNKSNSNKDIEDDNESIESIESIEDLSPIQSPKESISSLLHEWVDKDDSIDISAEINQEYCEDESKEDSPVQKEEKNDPTLVEFVDDVYIQPSICHFPTMVKIQQMYDTYKTAILKDICKRKKIQFEVAAFKVLNHKSK